MYCPNCAELADGVKFCRSCGVNIAFVALAMAEKRAENQAGAEIAMHHNNEQREQSAMHREQTSSASRIMTYFLLGLLLLLMSIVSGKIPLLGNLAWLVLSAVAFRQAFVEERRFKQEHKLKLEERIEIPQTPGCLSSSKLDLSKVPQYSIIDETTKKLDVK
jgi:hypothetical protein